MSSLDLELQDDILEEENEPRTLLEIAYEVGYPFKAKAVLTNSGDGALPEGIVITVYAMIKAAGEHHPCEPWRTYVKASPSSVGCGWFDNTRIAVRMDIPRWILVSQ